jgi:hypothetical protein
LSWAGIELNRKTERIFIFSQHKTNSLSLLN